MLSPGQDTPPSNYSSGNVVLQGAPCGQCRDLCPAGYVPHFWRRTGGRHSAFGISSLGTIRRCLLQDTPEGWRVLRNFASLAAPNSTLLFLTACRLIFRLRRPFNFENLRALRFFLHVKDVVWSNEA
ncbi:PREDICTED: uncharacterized protein LOC105153598 [Acromyrmex echinatior]|uniref:uncharacterized protein LOC105153598 n=1 Tax=Acromyrmex echinatior TaxID=103372 RepID=UPI000580E0A5|nr:PREDICTED: uncharacterized protein LOC105153598 [Acromyrmex echinatior]